MAQWHPSREIWLLYERAFPSLIHMHSLQEEILALSGQTPCYPLSQATRACDRGWNIRPPLGRLATTVSTSAPRGTRETRRQEYALPPRVLWVSAGLGEACPSALVHSGCYTKYQTGWFKPQTATSSHSCGPRSPRSRCWPIQHPVRARVLAWSWPASPHVRTWRTKEALVSPPHLVRAPIPSYHHDLI